MLRATFQKGGVVKKLLNDAQHQGPYEEGLMVLYGSERVKSGDRNLGRGVMGLSGRMPTLVPPPSSRKRSRRQSGDRDDGNKGR